MKIKIYNHKAFSLIELSIVILIIGILVAGVTSSSRLVKRMKLITAQNLTSSSPISSIKDLQFWYESSFEKSFNDSEETENSFVTMWYDNNQTNTLKSNMTTSTSTNNQPKYTESIMNGLPAIRFDGDDYFNFDSSLLVNNNFTIFVVERKTGLGTNWIFHPIGQTCGLNECLVIGYRADNHFTFAFYYNDLEFVNNNLIGSKNRIHSMIFDRSLGKKYWLDGGISPDIFQNVTSSIITNKTTVIGNAYLGYIAEFIVFNRVLKDEERQSIESYLSKKYAIPIS